MKKFHISLIMLLVSIKFSVAQSIIKDEVDSEGFRYIFGSLEPARDFKDKEVFSIGLSAFYFADTTRFKLIVKVTDFKPYQIKKNAVLILKTSNEDIITLYSDNNYDATVRDVHNLNGYVYSDYSTNAWYPISIQQIQQLINDGVLKIRQETFTGTHNKEYKEDKIGAIIEKEYLLISKALQTKKDIYDGF